MRSRRLLIVLLAGVALAVLHPWSAGATVSSRCPFGPDGSERGTHQYFSLRVVDTHGDPLACVELVTPSKVAVITDDQGVAAFFEPGLMNQRVYFDLRRFGHAGADYSGIDGLPEQFGGTTVEICEGGSAELVARESANPSGLLLPAACTPGSWQSRLARRPVAGREDVFAIQVIDRDTRRGIPMVEVRGRDGSVYTDSNGMLAYYDVTTMLGRTSSCRARKPAPTRVDFATPGYETRRMALPICRGGAVTVALKRRDVAQRIYRFTGTGIYRDTVILGDDDPDFPDVDIPIEKPLLNASVAHLDFASAVAFDEKVYWTFGDATNVSGHYGNYRGTGAISDLRALDPDRGIDLRYFADPATDFVRPMIPVSAGHAGVAWLLGLAVADDPVGESLFATIGFIDAGVRALGSLSLDRFTVATQGISPANSPAGTAFRFHHSYGDHLYRKNLIRHSATRSALLATVAYEKFSPLCLPGADPGCGADGVERGPGGVAVYRWRPGRSLVTSDDVASGVVRPEEVIFGKLRDIRAGTELREVAAAVEQGAYNEFRGRFVRVSPGVIIEPDGVSLVVFYAEADTPMGPWVYARTVLSVAQTLYGILHVPLFDRADGRIYFLGTHANAFGFRVFDPPVIPRYEGNQLMHALDLADPRVFLPIPIYDVAVAAPPGRFVTRRGLKSSDADTPAVFFAWDRPAEQTLAVTRSEADGRLVVGSASAQEPLFYLLPATDRDHDGLADVQDPCSAVAGNVRTLSSDPDLDGYGVACDGDYDNDGSVDQRDRAILRRHWGMKAGDIGFDPNLDHDGNGRIGASDRRIFRSLMRAPPGPSGLACAGIIPCLPETKDLVPLHEFVGAQGEYAYSLAEALPGFTRTPNDLGLVWRNPIAVTFPVGDYLR